MDVVQRVRSICALLLDTPSDSPAFNRYRSELKKAAAELRAQEKDWDKASQPDKHQNEARQSYRSRETNSADGFSKSLKLFTRTKQESDKKKD